MRTKAEIEILLNELDASSADSLEDQDLDFKEWSARSMSDSVALAVDMAICMANGGGGTAGGREMTPELPRVNSVSIPRIMDAIIAMAPISMAIWDGEDQSAGREPFVLREEWATGLDLRYLDRIERRPMHAQCAQALGGVQAERAIGLVSASVLSLF